MLRIRRVRSMASTTLAVSVSSLLRWSIPMPELPARRPVATLRAVRQDQVVRLELAAALEGQGLPGRAARLERAVQLARAVGLDRAALVVRGAQVHPFRWSPFLMTSAGTRLSRSGASRRLQTRPPARFRSRNP